jgi:hypothetical protein
MLPDMVMGKFVQNVPGMLSEGLVLVLFTELQKAREEERQMNSVKMSFEKNLQTERTLKIQVRDCLDVYHI